MDSLFNLHRLSDYSDESILHELRRVAAVVTSGPLTRSSFDQHSRASASTLMKRFGGWRQALEAAGLGDRYGGQVVSDRMRQQPGKAVTKEAVLDELRRVASKLGRQDLTVRDFNTHASFSVGAVRSYYKTWRQALAAAGLVARPTSVRYSDEECFENLLRVWTQLGRPPRYREMGSSLSQVGGKAYTLRWGSWIRALEAFVDRTKQDDPAAPVATVPCTEVANPSPDPDDGPVRLGVRYRVLVRDSFKCTLCGNSPARDPLCTLHVDHVHPRAKGGQSASENLRTLCDACNLGKGSLTIEAPANTTQQPTGAPSGAGG